VVGRIHHEYDNVNSVEVWCPVFGDGLATAELPNSKVAIKVSELSNSKSHCWVMTKIWLFPHHMTNECALPTSIRPANNHVRRRSHKAVCRLCTEPQYFLSVCLPKLASMMLAPAETFGQRIGATHLVVALVETNGGG
jgi:hypothetical protein